ncbi:MAG: hypothetical protein JWQ86_3752 [Mycobacterium sp.]|jgi:hypothetical protein|nr:hypothetical protein [Mycobacterium sp.]MDT5217104.1 hypothetical protein [Mycobacterium sp.]
MVDLRSFAVIAAATAFVAAFVAAPAHADGPKLSAAIGFGANGVIGVAENVTTSQDDARAQAVADCTQRGGIKCISIANVSNGCVAVSVGALSAGGGIGQTREKAEQMSRDQSKGGALKLSTCSLGGAPIDYGGGAGSYQLDQQAPAGGSNSKEVTGDVDVYDVPGGVGKVIGMLEGGEGQKVPLGSGCRGDNWCNIVWSGGPSGKAWVWGDFLK